MVRLMQPSDNIHRLVHPTSVTDTRSIQQIILNGGHLGIVPKLSALTHLNP